MATIIIKRCYFNAFLQQRKFCVIKTMRDATTVHTHTKWASVLINKFKCAESQPNYNENYDDDDGDG